jgi:hypothetical protein
MPETQSQQPNKKRRIEEDEHVHPGDREGQIIGKNRSAHRGTRSRKAQNLRRQRYIESGGPEQARNVIDKLTSMKS